MTQTATANKILPIDFMRCKMLTVPTLFHKLKRKRIVEPEILDVLANDDPAAIRSRRDLQLVNTLMGNQRWILKQLAKHLPERPENHWELGAGDGTLGAAVAQRFGEESPQLTALDLSPRSPIWPRSWDWQQRDILSLAAESPPAGVVVANLILHHFQDDELEQIGSWISAKAQTVIAAEPLRANFPHALAYAMRLLGINYVTREDIHTSINAGFNGGELPDRLGFEPDKWKINISTTLLGGYRMLARRRS